MKQVPIHLKPYVAQQDYSLYTFEDQAIWRCVLRQLRSYLKNHAHPCYLEGLKKTGLDENSIPQIVDMNEKLEVFDWGAVPVSGFIPPEAFMEFQALGFLPIVTEIRDIKNILYTPAPDIIHESAGHAPILIEPEFCRYLKKYAQTAQKALLNKEDLELYEAIKALSDIKEKQNIPQTEIQKKEKILEKTYKKIKDISEAQLLSRMNWWTVEYGLIGDIKKPKIFGAGLLSSIGESQNYLNPQVKKLPLTKDCLNYSYNITQPQPQLFVTPSFSHLNKVLDEFASQMAFRKGGLYSLNLALRSQTVNTIELNTGLQVSGKLENVLDQKGQIIFLKFQGPCQLSYKRQQLEGHGPKYHSHGYSTPLGLFKSFPEQTNWKKGDVVELNYESGIKLRGCLRASLKKENHILLYTFDECTIFYQGEILFKPEWGLFDLALGKNVESVFRGSADILNYKNMKQNFFVDKRESQGRKEKTPLDYFYFEIREFRENIENFNSDLKIKELTDHYFQEFSQYWLPGLELLELCYKQQGTKQIFPLQDHLKNLLQTSQLMTSQEKQCLKVGMRLAQERE